MGHSHNLQLESAISAPKLSHCKATIPLYLPHQKKASNSKQLQTRFTGYTRVLKLSLLGHCFCIRVSSTKALPASNACLAVLSSKKLSDRKTSVAEKDNNDF